jgi:hypothetical protein
MTPAIQHLEMFIWKSAAIQIWGKPVSESFSSTRPTSFEDAAASLGLSPRDYQKSKALQEWVARNKNSKYVPSDLLKAWGLEVKVDM